MTHRRAVTGAVLVVASACVLAWALAYPAASLTPALARAVSDGAAILTMGLAAIPVLDTGRYRQELLRRASAPLMIASAVWLVSEIVRLVLASAEAAGIGITRLAMQTAVEYALQTAPGRASLISVTAAAAVCALAAVTGRADTARGVATGLAGVGILGHPLTGHLSSSPWGGAAIAVHALAAALWCGLLAGLLLTVEHRGQWARILPRFSQVSLLCVTVLLAAGVLGASAVIGSPTDLYATGYGRVLSAKVVLTAALVALAWRNRANWLPAAETHRATAVVSRSRAQRELALMGAALAAAATLAVTG
ncbi:MAG: CopD family protein [Actinomycetia bacterium]|nr:CopD family protein [Actinomycetes bacterium]MCH9700030.1 CopD family protein [Actinomycetes bacterium]MCH9760803.1 CopD family protein [Actinomycetes bacterium]